MECGFWKKEEEKISLSTNEEQRFPAGRWTIELFSDCGVLMARNNVGPHFHFAEIRSKLSFIHSFRFPTLTLASNHAFRDGHIKKQNEMFQTENGAPIHSPSTR